MLKNKNPSDDNSDYCIIIKSVQCWSSNEKQQA